MLDCLPVELQVFTVYLYITRSTSVRARRARWIVGSSLDLVRGAAPCTSLGAPGAMSVTYIIHNSSRSYLLPRIMLNSCVIYDV